MKYLLTLLYLSPSLLWAHGSHPDTADSVIHTLLHLASSLEGVALMALIVWVVYWVLKK